MSCIEGYENYLIFEDGVVINTKFDREMKLTKTNGYYTVGLFKDRKQKIFTIHRLIALAFIPNPDNKRCVDHINRDRGDNRIENLRWVNHSENNINKSYSNNTGYQFIYKINIKTYKHGFTYQFRIRRPELRHCYSNIDLQNVIEFRNKFCEENNIEINDK